MGAPNLARHVVDLQALRPKNKNGHAGQIWEFPKISGPIQKYIDVYTYIYVYVYIYIETSNSRHILQGHPQKRS